MDKVKITYRGWVGHFICGHDCMFRLNTLLEYGDIKIVVSTVGAMKSSLSKKYETIGYDRYFETMAFHAEKEGDFWDADVMREINFESEWAWNSLEDEWKANKGHIAVVEEIRNGLIDGNQY